MSPPFESGLRPDVADRGHRAVDDFMEAAEAAARPSAPKVPSEAEA
jgi:hypothetical protein